MQTCCCGDDLYSEHHFLAGDRLLRYIGSSETSSSSLVPGSRGAIPHFSPSSSVIDLEETEVAGAFGAGAFACLLDRKLSDVLSEWGIRFFPDSLPSLGVSRR